MGNAKQYQGCQHGNRQVLTMGMAYREGGSVDCLELSREKNPVQFRTIWSPNEEGGLDKTLEGQFDLMLHVASKSLSAFKHQQRSEGGEALDGQSC